jgi:hypothetical protein
LDVLDQHAEGLVRQLDCINRRLESLKVVNKHDRVVRLVFEGECPVGERGSKEVARRIVVLDRQRLLEGREPFGPNDF